MGIETSPETVPTVDKQIIAKCHAAAKPVITATQTLDLMIRNPRPTCAASAMRPLPVLDGINVIHQLPGETALGPVPGGVGRHHGPNIAEAGQRLMSPFAAQIDLPVT